MQPKENRITDHLWVFRDSKLCLEKKCTVLFLDECCRHKLSSISPMGFDWCALADLKFLSLKSRKIYPDAFCSTEIFVDIEDGNITTHAHHRTQILSLQEIPLTGNTWALLVTKQLLFGKKRKPIKCVVGDSNLTLEIDMAMMHDSRQKKIFVVRKG